MGDYSHAMNLAYFNKQLTDARQKWVLDDGVEFYGTYVEAQAKMADLKEQ